MANYDIVIIASVFHGQTNERVTLVHLKTVL